MNFFDCMHFMVLIWVNTMHDTGWGVLTVILYFWIDTSKSLMEASKRDFLGRRVKEKTNYKNRLTYSVIYIFFSSICVNFCNRDIVLKRALLVLVTGRLDENSTSIIKTAVCFLTIFYVNIPECCFIWRRHICIITSVTPFSFIVFW